MNGKRLFRNPLLWVAALLALMFLTFSFSGDGGFARVDTSVAQQLLNEGKVQSARFTSENVLDLTLKEGQTYTGGSVKDADKVRTEFIDARAEELVTLVNGNVPGAYNDTIEHPSLLSSLLYSVLPLIILVGLFWFMMSQMQGGGSRVMQFGKSKAKLANKDTPKVTFADVAGADEAVEELQEIKEFLAEPAKFLAVGAKIPKGVLLYGPPGTGKTLLARAVAGEAGVPFYSISGSDFVEMFVGVGASRVRDLFEQAKANAPAIVFVGGVQGLKTHSAASEGRPTSVASWRRASRRAASCSSISSSNSSC